MRIRERTEYSKKYNRKNWIENRDYLSDRFHAWRIANKEKRNAYMRTWNAERKAKDPEGHAKLVRGRTLKRKYGITLQQYDAMLLSQGGHCALCAGTPDQEKYGYLDVDHCHTSGVVRGLLCNKCNTALGGLGDTVESLEKALAYLRRT